MQEHGVSRIVSVKFHKSDEQVTDSASLETPINKRPVEAEEDALHKREETIEVMMAK